MREAIATVRLTELIAIPPRDEGGQEKRPIEELMPAVVCRCRKVYRRALRRSRAKQIVDSTVVEPVPLRSIEEIHVQGAVGDPFSLKTCWPL